MRDRKKEEEKEKEKEGERESTRAHEVVNGAKTPADNAVAKVTTEDCVKRCLRNQTLTEKHSTM